MKKVRRKKELYSKRKWNRRKEMYFEGTKVESTNHQQVFLLSNSFSIDEGQRVTRSDGRRKNEERRESMKEKLTTKGKKEKKYERRKVTKSGRD